MENRLFAETAPPPQNIIKITDEHPDNQQISTFNERIYSAFDSIQPKIDSLERSLKLTEKNSLGPLSDTNSELNSNLLNLQATMPSIHSKSIKLSRKIQNLSLKAQASSTVAAPKRIRPIIDDFCSLKKNFDQSLKQISILTKNLNEKIKMLNGTIKKTSEESKSLKNLKKDLDNLNSANQCNSQIIDELKEKVIDQARNERSQLIENFDKSLTEAENLVKELEDLAEQGLDTSSKTIVKLENDKFDIQSSFDSLSSEIENSMNDRIKEILTKVTKNSEKNDTSFQKIDIELTNNLDKIIDDINESPAFSLLDQIEQQQEAEELEKLFNRIEQLEEGIKNHEFDPPNPIEKIVSNFDKITDKEIYKEEVNEENEQKDNKYIEDEKNEISSSLSNDSNAQIVTTMINGKKRKILCYEDGTFEYIQK